jgi:8-oxo-dGTP pyrophosphatase MutT (NUDIX family)
LNWILRGILWVHRDWRFVRWVCREPDRPRDYKVRGARARDCRVVPAFHTWEAEELMDAILRRAARLVVMDPDNHVLLLQYEDDPRNWWATPGGGLEGKETFEEAAAREAMEELSLNCATLIPLWCQTVEFTFHEQVIRQVERYFLARLPTPGAALGHTVGEAHRREGIVAARWWSLEEIETTSERVYPVDLCKRLRDLLAKQSSPVLPDGKGASSAEFVGGGDGQIDPTN